MMFPPPQINWSSFILLFHILFLEVLSPVAGGDCQLHCHANRFLASVSRYQAYTLNCNHLYGSNQGLLNDCINKCKTCSTSICSRSTPHIFKCPAIDIARCEKHCDANRPSGSTSAYTLKCDKKFQSSADIDKCKRQCDVCNFEICDSDKPNIFKCPSSISPSPPIGKLCKEHCDKERVNDNPYELDCLWISSGEIAKCLENCKHCTRPICNLYDPYLFKCPAKAPTTTTTKKTTTTTKKTTTTKRTTTTTTPKTTTRRTTTTKTPTTTRKRTTTKKPGQVTTTRRPGVTTTTTRGPVTLPCEYHCDKKRPKGSHRAYHLKCKDEYSMATEIAQCKKDCKRCTSICPPPERDEFHCPAIKDPNMVKPAPYKEPAPEEDSTMVIVGIAVGVTLLILVAGFVVYFFFIRKKKEKTRTEQTPEGLFEFSRHDDVSPVSSNSSLPHVRLDDSPPSSSPVASRGKGTSFSKTTFARKSAPATGSRFTNFPRGRQSLSSTSVGSRARLAPARKSNVKNISPLRKPVAKTLKK